MNSSDLAKPGSAKSKMARPKSTRETRSTNRAAKGKYAILEARLEVHGDFSAKKEISKTELVPFTSPNTNPDGAATLYKKFDNPSETSLNEPLHALLNNFTLFSKLPIEVRLMIWRLSVRVGHLSIQNTPFKDYGEASELWDSEEKAALPATLRVNKESRLETLRKCFLIYPHEVAASYSFSRRGTRPIYANPATDLCWLEFVTLIHSQKEIYDWLSSLQIKEPRFLPSVTRLEVRDFWFESFFKTIIAQNYNSSRERRVVYFAALLQFSGLKQIFFTGVLGIDWAGEAEKERVKWMKMWIGAFLEENKACFEDGEAPELIFRPYKTLHEVMMEN